jgi:LytR cell envelope-related transcriptional attenuator
VDHAFPAYETVRPWRTAAVVATLVAAVELVVILIAATIWLAKPLFAGKPAHAAAAPLILKHPVRTHAGLIKLSRAQTSVLVLNGSGQSGAAAATADTVQARGYTVASVGNAATTNYRSSVVMFRRGYRPEAVRLAHDLRVHRVAALSGITPAQLLGAQLALVVGNQ